MHLIRKNIDRADAINFVSVFCLLIFIERIGMFHIFTSRY
jgi:hypothetical protein